MKCVSCGHEGAMRATTAEHEVRIGERRIKGVVPASECPKCGEVYIEGADLERLEMEVAEAIIRAGVVDGATFRYLRHAIGMQAEEVAGPLGTSPETISR